MNTGWKKPLLSVAVITYNQEQYIAQTLDSILSQKHEYPYEIIVGEDCSPDGTRKIVEDYASRYPDIIKPLYNEPNMGLIKNYFNVLAHCSGKYVMECAGDDYWLPGKVQKQIQFMEAHPDVALCVGDVKQCDENGQMTGKYEVDAGTLEFEKLFMRNAIPAVAVCFRKDVFDEYLTRVDPLAKTWRMEDIPFWLFISHEKTIHHLAGYVAVYRVMSQSESHCVSPEKQKLFDDSCRDIRAFYADMFDAHKLYDVYVAEEAFQKAWNEKDRNAVISNGCVLLRYRFSLKKAVKVLLAKARIGL